MAHILAEHNDLAMAKHNIKFMEGLTIGSVAATHQTCKPSSPVLEPEYQKLSKMLLEPEY